MSDEPLYYIQNTRSVVGNCMVLWRAEGHGYTVNLDEAWKLPQSRAEAICKDRPEQDIPRAAALLERVAQRHIDVQLLWNEEE